MRTRPSPRSFGGGELAPWLDGITSEVTAKGCRTLENFLVMKQGPITRRPGTFYVAGAKDNDKKSVLIPCTIDDDNTYVIEAGENSLRFFKNHVQVTIAAAIYSIASPWSQGDVTDLRWCYVPDEGLVLWHPNHQARLLEYASATSWVLSKYLTISSPKIMVMENWGRILSTDDGKTWVQSPTGIANASGNIPAQVIYGDEKTLTAITTGEYDGVLTSTDGGDSWVQVPITALNTSRGVAGDPYNMFAALNGTSGTIVTSEDGGASWTQRNILGGILSAWAIKYNDTIHAWRFAATRASATNYETYGGYSFDGLTWASLPVAASGSCSASRIDSDGECWVAVGTAVASQAAAANGAIWYAASTAAAWTPVVSIYNELLKGVAYGGSLWVAVGVDGALLTSPTGTVWTSRTPITAHDLNEVLWVHGKYYAFGVGSDYYTSDTGLTWTSHTLIATTASLTINAATLYDKPSLEWFDTADHYPKTGTYHEGRLIFGATKHEPSTLWGSKSGNVFNFALGEFADDPWSYKIGADKNVDIQWIMGGMGGLVVGTRTAEGVMNGSEAEGITPLTAQFKWQSTFGSDNVQPVRVHDHIIFAQRGGEIIRGYVPGAGAQAYQSPDLTQYADHIAEGGVHEFDHQDDPQTIVYAVRHDGRLLALTFEGNTVAWSRIVTDGSIESVAVIPTSGAEDEVWAVVKRNINGATSTTVRYIEYFDKIKLTNKESAHYVDCGYVNSTCASATVYQEVMPWLAGESVDVLVNGNVVEHGKVISASGTLTITNTAAVTIHAGLPCPAYAQTMRLESGSTWGAGMGLSKRNANLLVWVHETIGGEYGPELSITEAVTFSIASSLTTDLLEVNFPGTWDRDGYIWVCQRDPLPMTVVAVAPDIETGDA